MTRLSGDIQSRGLGMPGLLLNQLRSTARAELQARIDEEIGRPPEGCWLGWGGQFEGELARG